MAARLVVNNLRAGLIHISYNNKKYKYFYLITVIKILITFVLSDYHAKLIGEDGLVWFVFGGLVRGHIMALILWIFVLTSSRGDLGVTCGIKKNYN